MRVRPLLSIGEAEVTRTSCPDGHLGASPKSINNTTPEDEKRAQA
jgi:hypothetical protein